MRAVILCAGEGTRLRPHTLAVPKCLVELVGKPLLVHQLDVLAAAGVHDVTLVTGHRAERLAPFGLPMVRNPRYDRTNMVASLMCARERLDGRDDVLVLYGDIVYERRVVDAMLASDEPLATAVNLDWLALWKLRMADPLADAETLKLDASGAIVEIGQRPRSVDDVHGQYMGITRLGAAFCGDLVAFHEALVAAPRPDLPPVERMDMTTLLAALVRAGHRLAAVCVHGGWLEVDSCADLQLYERLAAAGTLAPLWRPADGLAGAADAAW